MKEGRLRRKGKNYSERYWLVDYVDLLESINIINQLTIYATKSIICEACVLVFTFSIT